MKKTPVPRTVRPFLVSALLLLICASGSAQEVKWIKVGRLHSWYMESGSEPEVARRGLVTDQIDGLRWPADFRDQDAQAAKALWIGATNYNDAVAGRTYNHKVVHVGPRVWDDQNEFMPMEFRMIGRFDHPTVLVDGLLGSSLVFDDIVEEVDPDLRADRLIINKVRTSMGVEMTRKIYSFSQQYHNNYMIYEYVFKNTGIVDLNGRQNVQQLDGTYFFWQYRWSVCREMGAYGLFVMPQSATWGHNTMNDARGEDPAGDPFRALFSWHGRHSAAGFDNIGAPNGGPGEPGDGRLLASQYVGVVTLHADRSATDKSDDPAQPATTQYQSSDAGFQSANDQYNGSKMSTEYTQVIAAGHPLVRHADEVGDCPSCYADDFGGTPGGYSQTHGYGPYTLAPGDSIRIVLAEAMNGLSRAKNIEIGDTWKFGDGPYPLPGGGTTTDADEYKAQWVYSGRDSIFQTFNRAIANWESDFALPQPPPPPELFEVNSGGDRIRLSWADNATSWPGFAGYRLYRAVQVPDTTYDLIFECGPGTANPAVVHAFDDVTAVRGFDYYYYVVSFDDGSNNNTPLNPGGSLQSSRFYTQTVEPANLKRPAGRTLEGIRIVPNPFIISSRELQFGTDAGRDRILFAGLPPFCQIKIFTERGDLIRTLEHTNATGDEIWDSVTSSRQIVVSGVYIAYIEVTEDYNDPATGEPLYKKGENTFRKFIVIR